MYVMKVDDQVFYAPTYPQSEYQVLTPKLKLEVNTAGELTFTLPPGHVMRDFIRRMKSVITVEQDGVEIFRGRVTEETVDMFNQKECYCEGDLAFLRDSIQRPYTYEGSAKDYFKQLIAEHNKQVDEDKKFTVGLMTALSDDDEVDTESEDYKDTLGEIGFILENEFGGYLRTRYANGVRYIDYIDEYDDSCATSIEFGINLLDVENQIDSQDICTILIPLGKIVDDEYTTIESVNDDKDYIVNVDLVDTYGRIWQTYTWDDIDDPSELLEKGKEKLKEMAVTETLTIKAVDLQMLGIDAEKIRCGSKVHLLSAPHGIDKEDMCTVIEIDMQNPENTTYTFGEPNETLSDSVSANTSSASETSSRLKEDEYKFNVTKEYVNELGTRMNVVEFDMDALEATILLKASQAEVDELGQRVTSAEIAIDGANATIELKASKTEVDALGKRVSSAEITLDGINATIDLKVSKDDLISAINMSPESIKISSAKIELDGATVVSTLKGLSIDVSHIDTYSIDGSEGSFSVLDATSAEISTLNCESLVVGGTDASWQELNVKTGNPTVLLNTTDFSFVDGNGDTRTIRIPTSTTVSGGSTKTIKYLGA